MVVGKVRNAAYNEIVKDKAIGNGEERLGQVLETSEQHAVVQVFGPTEGINDRQHNASASSARHSRPESARTCSARSSTGREGQGT